MMSGENSEQSSRTIVRAHNIDFYLASLFVPQAHRASIFALYAFDAEITRIGFQVHEPMMGEIRLQWWREVISGDRTGEARSHPTALGLLKTIDQYNLPRRLFDQYCAARVFDFYNDPMPDMSALEAYAGETASTLFNLAATIINGGKDANCADAAGHAGVAWTIMHILKSIPRHRARQQCFIPVDMLKNAGASVEDWQTDADAEVSAALVASLVLEARHHLEAFRKALVNIPDPVRVAFLPLALVSSMLGRLDKAGAHAITESIDIAQWRKQITLWRAARRGTY